MTNNKCINCFYNSKKISINFPFFEHENFTTTFSKSVLLKCSNCQLLFRKKNINLKSFKSKNYIKKNNEHLLFSKNNKVQSRSKVLAKIILKNIRSENLKVLEIGCGKGNLLNELLINTRNSKFYGYDIGNYSRFSNFKKKNITFIDKNIHNFKEKGFDLIVVSHALNYFLNPKKEIEKYKKIINKDGLIIFTIPDISKNIFYTLMSDQKTVFTKHSIKYFLYQNNLSCRFIKNNTLAREIICISKIFKNKAYLSRKKDNTINKNLLKLNLIKKKILKIKSKNISILGTSVSSAFIDEILNCVTKNFVNDFNKKKGIYFRGKKVINRKKLVKNDLLINTVSTNKLQRKKTKAKIINIF